MVPLRTMKAPRTALPVLASPLVAAVAVLGLVALCMAALDVPQGLSDKAVVDSWSHGTGPFVALLGLAHLGRGLLPWSLVALLLLHGLASHLSEPGSRRLPLGIPGAIASVLVVLSLAAFLWTGVQPASSDARDSTRLSIEPVLDTAPGGNQVVEEGAVYQLPGAGGSRVVSFGVLAAGPWAAERRADGTVVAHLPPIGSAAPTADVSFRVDARRPLAVPAATPLGDPALPVPVSAAIALLSALAAAAALLLGAQGARSLAPAARQRVTAWVALALLAILANPFAGPGLGLVPLGSPGMGAPVLYALLARSPLDVSSWVGAFPAWVELAPLAGVSLATTFALLLFLAIRAATPRQVALSRAAGLAAGALAIASGVLLLAYAAARLPLAVTFDGLVARFQQDLLPRLPASLSVLEAAPTHDGPYRVSMSFGLLACIGPLAAGVALVLSHASAGKPGPVAWEPAALILAALALARAASLFLAPGFLAIPAAAVPVSLVSAALAAASVVVRRRHPRGDVAALASLALAATLQFALAA
jgi:hypothetical protein